MTGPCTGRLGIGPIGIARTAKLVERREPLFPPRREILDLIEFQGRPSAFADDDGVLAFLERQRHRAQDCGVQFHRAVIGQGDELFGVQCHRGMPTIAAGLSKTSTCAPDARCFR
jgi:hypothetical protein